MLCLWAVFLALVYAEVMSPVVSGLQNYLPRALNQEWQQFLAELLKGNWPLLSPYALIFHVHPHSLLTKFMFASQHDTLFYGYVQEPSRCQQIEIKKNNNRLLHYWISLPLEFPYAGAEL